MFERKNQGVLAHHYSALINHDDLAQDGDDDFLTLEKRDHTLNEIGLSEAPTTLAAASLPEINLSKRKTKMGESKKAMLKNKGLGHKVVFDDEGAAHEMYEMAKEDDISGDMEGKREAYVKLNQQEMRIADEEDRRVAREKKQEKKRKRKDREREVGTEYLHFCLFRWY